MSNTRAIRAEGGGAAELLLSISTNSFALILGMMLVLVSLLLQAIPQEYDDGTIGYRLPTFYVITRPLLILIALAYLAIIPCQAMASHKLRSDGMGNLDRNLNQQRQLIDRMMVLSQAPDGIASANRLLDQYQVRYRISIPTRPRTSAEFEQVSARLREISALERIKMIRSADSHLSAKTMIVFTTSIIDALLIWFYWLKWPRKSRLITVSSDAVAAPL